MLAAPCVSFCVLCTCTVSYALCLPCVSPFASVTVCLRGAGGENMWMLFCCKVRFSIWEGERPASNFKLRSFVKTAICFRLGIFGLHNPYISESPSECPRYCVYFGKALPWIGKVTKYSQVSNLKQFGWYMLRITLEQMLDILKRNSHFKDC